MSEVPKCYILRHGQTEWSEIGRRTSYTDLSLTEKGRDLVGQTRDRLVGHTKLIDPSTLAKVFVSPLVRAQETLALLNLPSDVPVETTSLLTEFNYGDFEGMKTSQIKSITGNPKWETWTDAAPNAETPAQVQKRIDTMISKIKGEYHAPALADSSVRRRNILLVAHGHILRGVGARWLNLHITHARSLQLDAGGVSVLSYEHNSLEEPAINRWNLIQ